MKVLLTGNMSQISNLFISKLAEGYKCIIYNDKENYEFSGKNVINYCQQARDEEDMERIFSAHNFETVLFFSYALDGGLKVYDELEKLENVILESRKYKVKHFIYITTNDLKEERTAFTTEKSRNMIMKACQGLCQSFSEETDIKFLVMKLPYLYNMQTDGNKLMQWVKLANAGGSIRFRGTEYQVTDFLCDEDLAGLILRVLDELVIERYREINISGENPIEFHQLAELMTEHNKEADIVFENHDDCIPRCEKDTFAREVYGWYPKHEIVADVKSMLKERREAEQEKQKTMKRKRQYQDLTDKVRVILEVAALCVIAEVLNLVVADNVLLNFIDFRLVAVTIIGTMNGLSAGVMAAVLSSLGYVLTNSADMQWQIIFYNVENWLPFACYFLLGTIPGYTRDKHDDEVVYAKEEYHILEKKYSFLVELYTKVLESKDHFNSQIIGYKDSFGKVYSVVKKLDTVLPDRVFYEAVNVLEELLANYSVAIYTVNKESDFARLSVCSKSLNDVLNKSLDISEFPQMMEAFYEKKTFANTACLKEYPMYGAPIYKDDELMGMILLVNGVETQLNMEFSNKFNIIADLIGNALVIAMDFERISNQFIPGTQILEKEKFTEILSVKEQMDEKNYIDYVLLKIVAMEEMKLQDMSDRISRVVRNNDIIGQGEDGSIYLLLNQAKTTDLDAIRNRLTKHKITFEVVKGS